jgi:hypothetical protein
MITPGDNFTVMLTSVLSIAFGSVGVGFFHVLMDRQSSLTFSWFLSTLLHIIYNKIRSINPPALAVNLPFDAV